MSSKAESVTLSLSPLPDLPDDMLAAIGLVMVKHSIMETLLMRTCYLLAGVDDVTGRLAIREPRTSDRLAMLADLAKHRNIQLDQEAIKTLNRDIPTATKMRDTLAHSLYFQHPEKGHYMVRETAGTWRPGGTKASVKKKVQPSGPIISAEAIIGIAKLIYSINEILMTLHREVELQVQPQ